MLTPNTTELFSEWLTNETTTTQTVCTSYSKEFRPYTLTVIAHCANLGGNSHTEDCLLEEMDHWASNGFYIYNFKAGRYQSRITGKFVSAEKALAPKVMPEVKLENIFLSEWRYVFDYELTD